MITWKRSNWRTLIVVVAAAFLGYWIAFYTVDPSFHVTAGSAADGSYRFEISPNFVVRSMTVISMLGPKGTVMKDGKQAFGKQTIVIASGLTPNDTVRITCGLQYDRLMPSATTRTKSIVIR